MKKALKAVRIILLTIVVLFVVALVAAHLLADRVLKIGIEAAGSRALNVGVSVGNVDISIMSGKIGLRNLVINNPQGYQYRKLLELKNAQIEVDIKSLLSDTVDIRAIKLDGLNVVLEQRGISSNNLQDVIKSIPAGDKKTEPSGKKLHIDSLEITNVIVKAKPLPIPGRMDTIPLKLKPIRMTNLGSDNKLDTARLSSKILLAIAGGVAEQGTGVLPDEVVNPLTGELKKLGKLPGVLLKGGGKILKVGTDLGKEAAGGLKGLFKPEKNKK